MSRIMFLIFLTVVKSLFPETPVFWEAVTIAAWLVIILRATYLVKFLKFHLCKWRQNRKSYTSRTGVIQAIKPIKRTSIVSFLQSCFQRLYQNRKEYIIRAMALNMALYVTFAALLFLLPLAQAAHILIVA